MQRTVFQTSVLLIVYVVVCSAACPSFAQAQRMHLDPAPKELKLGGEAVSVPMERLHGWAVVDAKVNGKGPFRFVLDTGAPGLLVDDRFKERMNLTPDPESGGMVAQVRVAGPGGEGLPATLHLVETLTIGSAELRGLRTIATKLPFRRDIAGVIGMGMFKECLLTLDYPGSKITLARGELPPADGRQILEFTQTRQRGSHPDIKVEVCGKTYDFTLDTGMTGWIVFPEDVAEHCGFSFGPVDGLKGRSVDREMDTRVARLDGALKFGAHVVQNPHGRVNAGMHESPLLGSRILQEFALTIDQKNLRIRFARAGNAPIVPPAYRVAGFSLKEEEEEGFVVWGLMPDSPAARAGLENGDIVVAFDGKLTGEVYGWPVWDEILEGDTVKVRYKSKDQPDPREVDVAILELVP